LSRIAGGDQQVVRDQQGQPVANPQTGQVVTRTMTKRSLGASILAGALSAMAANEANQPYRNGNGIWVNPTNEAVAAGDEAFQARSSKNQIQQAQQQANNQRTQAYATYEANLKMLTQTQQLYQLKSDQMTKAVDHYKDLSDQFAAGNITNPETGESLYDPNFANLTPSEAEAHLKKGDFTRDLMFPVSVEPIIGKDGEPTGQSQLRWAAIKGPANVHISQEMIDKYPELKGASVNASIPLLQYLRLARTSADNSSLGAMIQNVADTQVSEKMPGAKQVDFNWNQFRKDARLTPDQIHQMHALAGMPPDEFMSKIRAMDQSNGGGGRIAEALVKQGINIDEKAWALKRDQAKKETEAQIAVQVKITSVANENDARAVLANPTNYPLAVVAQAKAFLQGEENTAVSKENRVEGYKQAAEQRRQDDKDRRTSVYAEDANGQTVLSNKLDHPEGEEMKSGDINKDRQAMRQLNDVQLNTSRYTKAAQDYDAANLPATTRAADNVNTNGMLNKAGIGDFNVAIAEGGKVEVPILSSFLEGLSRQQRSNDYKQLSPQGKALFDGYIRTMSAIPAYQKALTGIGRSNKEMLDLELANIPSPLLDAKDIIRKQSQFQENIDRATEGFPRLPGLKHPSQTRQEVEGSPALPPMFRRDPATQKVQQSVDGGRTWN
jgi:hypothetical protein